MTDVSPAVQEPAKTKNTSGEGEYAVIPAELRGLNWGGFLLSWIWGIGSNVWIALATLIPYVGWIMPFVLLFKGNEWAWKKKKWNSVEHFRSVQKKWVKWGVAIWGILILIVVVVIYLVLAGVKSSDYYSNALELLRNDPRVVEALGSPVEAGWYVLGSVETSGATGKAEISIPLSGSRTDGTAYLLAEKELGQWLIKALAVDVDETQERIPLIRPDGDPSRLEKPM